LKLNQKKIEIRSTITIERNFKFSDKEPYYQLQREAKFNVEEETLRMVSFCKGLQRFAKVIKL